MDEFEEKNYQEIKQELVQSVIDKKIDIYFTNKNELTHYYNVGKMIEVDAQGGDEKAKYGDSLIKKISDKLNKDGINRFSTRSLKYMRRFYIFQKGQVVPAQLSWSHYIVLFTLTNVDEINYYINICLKEKISYRKLHKKITDNGSLKNSVIIILYSYIITTIIDINNIITIS